MFAWFEIVKIIWEKWEMSVICDFSFVNEQTSVDRMILSMNLPKYSLKQLSNNNKYSHIDRNSLSIEIGVCVLYDR